MEKMAGKLQRPVSLFLAAVMVLSTLYPVAAAESSLVKPTQASTIDMPTVQIEGSVIQNQFGQFTGFFELALRVSTPNNKMFRDLMVSLVYDSSMLTPVSWEAVPDENGAVTPLALGEGEYSTQQSAKKADGIATAVALTQAATEGSNSNLLYFHAESMKGVSLPDRTTLAVVRFKMADAAIQKFSLQDKGDGTTQLLYDGIAADAAAMTAHFVHFSPDEAAVDSPAGQSLYYYSGDNQFYYTPVTARETVTEKVLLTGNSTATDVPYTAPKTLGKKVLAVDEAKAGTAEYYSYLSNLLPEGNVSFSLTTGESYAKTGLELDKLCVITYMDWDDTILGTQIVPQNADVRKLVNDYVKDNFIYPELQNNTNYTSTARADSYRGKYPYSGPSGSATEERADGTDFPLTNKLEYTFLKKGMGKNTSNPAAPIWKQTGIDTAYPFIHGWAIVPSEGECWTTLGVGELAGYNAAAGTLPITSANLYFQPADFVDIRDHAITVKAIYEPGEKLKKDYQYSIAGKPEIGRYGYTASTENATYAIKYQYERIYTDGYGVSRAREPVVKQGTIMDALSMDGNNSKSAPVYMEIKVENKDIINVMLTPAGAVWSLTYVLADTYGTNFVLASDRSVLGNSMNIPSNFDYEHFKYSTRLGSDGLVFQATLNTILKEAVKAAKGDANALAQHFKVATAADLNLKANLSGSELIGASLDNAVTKIKAAVAAAMSASGSEAVSLTWHQLQYHIIHASSDGSGGIIGADGSIMSDEACKAAETYKWCRLLDGCVGSNLVTVETLLDLLNIIHAGDEDSLKLLTLDQVNNSPLYLRSSESGVTFVDLSIFIDQMRAIIISAGTSYSTLTWPQAQYALINGGIVVDANAAQNESDQKYYWREGLRPVTDWTSFLNAAHGAANGNSGALNLLSLANINNAPLYLRTDIDGASFTNEQLDDFRAAIKRLVNLAGENWATITWEQTQYYLIHGGSAMPSAAAAKTEADQYYYWAGGARPVTDLASLLAAAQLANNGKSAALNTLTDLTQLTDNTKYLRSSFKGDSFTDVAAFKAAVRVAVAAGSTALSWNELQYSLIHGTAGDAFKVAGEAGYYWWSAGAGGGASVTLKSKDVASLVDAAYRAGINGNRNAWGNLTDASKIFETFRLVSPPFTGAEGSSGELTKFGDPAHFQTQVETLVATAITEQGLTIYQRPTLTWYQVQHYLLTGIYLSGSDPTLPGKPVYWWLDADIPIKSPTDALVKFMEQFLNGTMSDTDLKAKITAPLMNTTYYLRRTTAGATYVAAPVTQINAAKTAIVNLANAAKINLDYYSDGKLTLTWYQIQYFIINSSLLPHEDAKAVIDTWGATWIPEGADPDAEAFSRRAMTAVALLQEETAAETVTSEDGLTVTSAETVSTRDAAGNAVTTTTVTAVTTVAVETETERITTAVTTTTVTTVTIPVAGGVPAVTTVSKTTTATERVPLETEVVSEPENPAAPEIVPALETTDAPETEEPTERTEPDTVQPETPARTEKPGAAADDPNREPVDLPPESTEEPELIGTSVITSLLWRPLSSLSRGSLPGPSAKTYPIARLRVLERLRWAAAIDRCGGAIFLSLPPTVPRWGPPFSLAPFPRGADKPITQVLLARLGGKIT